MSAKLSLFVSLILFTLVVTVTPVFAISISCSSGGGGESISSSDTFDLDDTTALQESINLDAGSIFKSRQADGSGNNNISESIAGNDFSLENNIQSLGTFSTTSSAFANSESGALSQDVAGTGSISVSLSSAEGSREASQAASVSYGAIDSVQAIAAGDGVTAVQSTAMAGEGGSILSGAVGDENVMGATGTFTGAGLMSASLASFASAETGRATSDGSASLDGVTLIDSGSFEAVSSQSLEIGLEGLRDVGDGSVGGFDMNVLNQEQAEKESAASTSTSAAATAGGSYSSYVLTGYRWNQNNPQVQLYLNPNNAPSGLTAVESQTAIAAAANSWDDAVAQNIFADSSTVIVDSTKAVDNPFSSTPISDGYNVHGWASMGGSYLGMCRWWSNGVTKDGYKSILEADTWYASDKAWTTDLSKATGGTFDLQSVAVHELGHTIGLGDLYSLPSTDPRKSDFSQVMNAYNGAQRTLGNGDLTGAQQLYGAIGWWNAGGYLTSEPHLLEDANGIEHIFARGIDCALWDYANGKWNYLGGYLTSEPFPIKDSQGRIHIFARGADNALWDYIDGDWHDMDGYLTTNPYAIEDEQGRIHILVRGIDNGLWDKVFDTSNLNNIGTLSWQNLGGIVTANPCAVLDSSSNLLKIGVRGIDNALWVKDLNTQDMSSSNWQYFGGILTADPYAIEDLQGQEHFLARGIDFALWDNINGNWVSMDGYLTSNPYAIEDELGRIHLLVRGTDNGLWDKTFDTSSLNNIGTLSWQNIGGTLTSGPSALSDSSLGSIKLCVRGIDYAAWIKEY